MKFMPPEYQKYAIDYLFENRWQRYFWIWAWVKARPL